MRPVFVALLLLVSQLVLSKSPLNDAISASIGQMVSDGSWEEIYGSLLSEIVPPSGCNVSFPDPPTDDLLQVLHSGKLRIGAAVIPPYYYLDDAGHLAGYEAGLARKITATLSYKYQVQLEPEFTIIAGVYGYFPELALSLSIDELDLIIAAISIIPERSQYVEFTCPYMSTFEMALRTHLEPTLTLTINELNNPRVSIGVISGSVGERYATVSLSRAYLRTYDTFDSLMKAAIDEEFHVAIADHPSLSTFISTNPTYTLIRGELGALENYAIGTTKGCMVQQQTLTCQSNEEEEEIIVVTSFLGVIIVFVVVLGLMLGIFCSVAAVMFLARQRRRRRVTKV